MGKLYVADRETGTFIDEVRTIDDGLLKIKEYEENDKSEGVYEPGFYDVVDEEHGSVL